MDLKELEHFIAVYDERSFSGAARALGTVQSNVSGRIRALEKRLGVELLERRWREVVPTRAGDKLYRDARKIMNLLQKLENAARRPRSSKR